MLELNIQAPINVLGYGTVGFYLCRELSKKTKVNLFNIGNIQPQEPELYGDFEKMVKNTSGNVNFNAPFIKIFHQFDLASHIGRGPYFGFPIFELTKFNELEISHLGVPDYLLTPSVWSQSVLEESGFSSHVVRFGVDTNIFCNRYESSDKTYKFINVGKWEKRKGHDILIKAFNKAFNEDDDVELWMMTHNPFLSSTQSNTWINQYRNSKLGSKVRFINPVKTHREISEILYQVDCGVFPSRAEGWNMELLECMAIGLPVIATDYAAHTEYCDEDNCSLISVDELEAAYDGKWFFGQGDWALLDYEQEEQLVQYMRDMYKNRPNNERGVKTAQKFSWESSASSLLDVIGEYEYKHEYTNG